MGTSGGDIACIVTPLRWGSDALIVPGPPPNAELNKRSIVSWPPTFGMLALLPISTPPANSEQVRRSRRPWHWTEIGVMMDTDNQEVADVNANDDRQQAADADDPYDQQRA